MLQNIPDGARPLPRDTRQLLNDINVLNNCKNLGLILDKYQPWKYNNESNWYLQFRYQGTRHGQPEIITAEEGEAKGWWFRNANENPRNRPPRDPVLNRNAHFDADLLDAVVARWKNMVAPNYFEWNSKSRVILGLGNKGTLETGITLHHLYGFPYIPGSALKGLTQARALFSLAELWGVPPVGNDYPNPQPLKLLELLLEAPWHDPKEMKKALLNLASDPLVIQAGGYAVKKEANVILKELQNRDSGEANAFYLIRQVFGCQGHQGAVVFYDAIPSRIPIIAVDVMTPHFPDYYQKDGQNPPTDKDKPNPVAYLAVEKGQPFLFGLGVNASAPPELMDFTRNFLQSALQELGIGGKTSSGMGRFGKIGS